MRSLLFWKLHESLSYVGYVPYLNSFGFWNTHDTWNHLNSKVFFFWTSQNQAFMDRLQIPIFASKYKLILATKANYHSLIPNSNSYTQVVSQQMVVSLDHLEPNTSSSLSLLADIMHLSKILPNSLDQALLNFWHSWKKPLMRISQVKVQVLKLTPSTYETYSKFSIQRKDSMSKGEFF